MPPSEEEPGQGRSPLVREVSSPVPFVKAELRTMWIMGWPMLISFFCRFAMMSTDAAFVGHLKSTPGGPHTTHGEAQAGLASLGRTFFGSLGADHRPELELAALEELQGRRLEEDEDEDALAGAMLMPGGLMLMEGAGVVAGRAPYGVTHVSGHTTKEYLGGASLSDMLTSVATVPLLAMGFGLGPLVGQAMGSGNPKMAGTWFQLAVFCVTLSAIPLHVVFFLTRQILEALNFEPALCELAGTYSMFSSLWVLPNSWFVIMRFYYQAQGKPRPAMWAALIFLGVNAFLNWLFVFGGPFSSLGWWHGMGFIGAAVAISTSRDVQSLCYFLYMWVWRKAHVPTWPGWNFDFLSRGHVRAFLKQTMPQVGSLFLQIAIGQCTTLLVARLGSLSVAASSAATASMAPLTMCFLVTLSALAGMRVGFYLGKGEAVLAKRTAYLILGCGASIMFIFGCIIIPLRHEVMHFFTSDPEVRALALEIMTPVLVYFLASSLVQTGTGGVLASQGRTSLATYLAIFFELPLSLGSIAVEVLYFKCDIRVIYWTQAAAALVEALVVLVLISRSDWEKYAEEAQRRQHALRRPTAPQPTAVPAALEESSEDADCGAEKQGDWAASEVGSQGATSSTCSSLRGSKDLPAGVA